MPRLALASLCAILIALTLPSPTLAQKAAPKPAAVPTDRDDLARWCNQMVFRKYGQPAPEYGRNMLKMSLDQAATMQDACIRSKGRII